MENRSRRIMLVALLHTDDIRNVLLVGKVDDGREGDVNRDEREPHHFRGYTHSYSKGGEPPDSQIGENWELKRNHNT